MSLTIPQTDPRRGTRLRRARGLWTMMEVATAADIPKSTFHDWAVHGLVPRPSTMLVRRKYYTTPEVEQILRLVEHWE